MKEITVERMALITLMILLLTAISWGFMVAITRQQDIQTVMLCESAKKSGNVEYLKKCDKYYETGNISDMEE